MEEENLSSNNIDNRQNTNNNILNNSRDLISRLKNFSPIEGKSTNKIEEENNHINIEESISSISNKNNESFISSFSNEEFLGNKDNNNDNINKLLKIQKIQNLKDNLKKLNEYNFFHKSYVRCLLKEKNEKLIPLIKYEGKYLSFSDRKNIIQKMDKEDLINITFNKELFIQKSSNNSNIINDAYICQKHKESYNDFCFECKENICEKCQNEEHKNHSKVKENSENIIDNLENIIISIIKKIYNKIKKEDLDNFNIEIVKLFYCHIINRIIKEKKINDERKKI